MSASLGGRERSEGKKSEHKSSSHHEYSLMEMPANNNQPQAQQQQPLIDQQQQGVVINGKKKPSSGSCSSSSSSSSSRFSLLCCCYVCCYTRSGEKKPTESTKDAPNYTNSQRETLNTILNQLQRRRGGEPPIRRMKIQLNKRRSASPSIDKQMGCNNNKQKRNLDAINNLIESRRRVVRLSIVLVLLFLFSWLPYHIISLTMDVLVYAQQTKNESSTTTTTNKSATTTTTTASSSGDDSHFIGLNIYPIALCLALANSVTNPVCYISLSHGFRNMFKTSFNRVFNCFNNV